MSGFAVKLGKARSFVEAARLVCEQSKQLGAQSCLVTLIFDGGPIALAIENYDAVSDDFRWYAITHDYWDTDPMLVAMREHVRPACVRSYGYHGPHGELLASPILGSNLAAGGHTNSEIADALTISINTVKSRLKEVFERMGIHNRTELANVLLRLAPLQGIPIGISRFKSVSVPRGVSVQRGRAGSRT